MIEDDTPPLSDDTRRRFVPSEQEDEPAPQFKIKEDLVARANAISGVALELAQKGPHQDPELNLLTLVSGVIAVPVGYVLFHQRLVGALGILAIPTAALGIFWLIRTWSAIMVVRFRDRAVESLNQLSYRAAVETLEGDSENAE